MLLRNLIKNFRNQKWFEVTIELLVVVFGIFLALQADDWNQERQDLDTEREYLERLLDDMNGSIIDYDRTSFWDQNLLEAQYVVLQSLKSGKLAEEDKQKFRYGLAWLGIHNPQRRRWGTVEELYATGNISLIQDLTLRSNISQIGAWYDRNNEIVKMQVQRIINLRSKISDRYRIDRFESTNGNAELDYNFDELVADKAFINIYADIHSASDMVVSFTYGSMSRIEALRDEIAEHLGVETTNFPQLKALRERPWYLEELSDFPEPD